MQLTLGEVLAEPGDETQFCYFPIKGVISMVSLMTSGAGAEIGIIGTEGFIGYNVLLGSSTFSFQALVQGTGEAHRIAASDLVKLCEESEGAKRLLLSYINSFVILVSQCAACNALHKAEARMARWVLQVQDRMDGNPLPITHEFLANMLGIRRATITVVANVLERAGLIKLGRREIVVLDREGLLKSSCECYPIMADVTSRALQGR